MILDSLRSLVWALVTLFLIVYVFSVCFTQSCTDFLRSSTDRDVNYEIVTQFGNVPAAIYSCVTSILGGISWGEIAETLMIVGAFPTILFLMYILFVLLAVLNIFIGVFVDNALEASRSQREFLVEAEQKLKEKSVRALKELFGEIDSDGDEVLTYEEVVENVSDQTSQAYFRVLGLSAEDIEQLFTLLDTDGSGKITMEEFLTGCLRMQGEAKRVDTLVIQAECRKVASKLERMNQQLNVAIDSINRGKKNTDDPHREFGCRLNFSLRKMNGKDFSAKECDSVEACMYRSCRSKFKEDVCESGYNTGILQQ